MTGAQSWVVVADVWRRPEATPGRATRPESSSTIIQRAMSAAVLVMPAAGLAFSPSKTATGTVVPSTVANVPETLSPWMPSPTAARVSAMPRRSRMRVCTNCSHDRPEAASTTSPATMYSTLS